MRLASAYASCEARLPCPGGWWQGAFYVPSSSPMFACGAAIAGPLPCAGAHFCFVVGLLFLAARDRSIFLVADGASRQWIRLLDFGEGVVGWGVSLFLRHLGYVCAVPLH